ncbi:DIAP2 protein, partial [Polypterus senegalus]
MVKDTEAEGYFLSILQHLMLIRNDYFVSPHLEPVPVIQYIRHNVPPDIKSEPDMAVQYVTKRMEKEGAISGHGNHSVDEEFIVRQEAQVQLVKKEEKIKELEAELQAFKSRIRPHEMSENCFWVVATEDRFESADLLAKLSLTFGNQKMVTVDCTYLFWQRRKYRIGISSKLVASSCANVHHGVDEKSCCAGECCEKGRIIRVRTGRVFWGSRKCNSKLTGK